MCLFGVATAGAQSPALAANERFDLLAQQITEVRVRVTTAFSTGRRAAAARHQGKFFADQIEIFADKDLLVASGNVVFANQEGRIAAERAEFDAQEADRHVLRRQGHHAARRRPPIHVSSATSRPTCISGARPSSDGDRRYRISSGGFTTCVQPTPRWELFTDTVVAEPQRLRGRDQHRAAREGCARVLCRGCITRSRTTTVQPDSCCRPTAAPRWPAIRATPSSGRSDAVMTPPSFTTGLPRPGRARAQSTACCRRRAVGRQRSGAHRIDQHETEFTDDGQTSVLPATKSFEVSGNTNHSISRNVRARARLEYFLERDHPAALLPGCLQGDPEQPP